MLILSFVPVEGLVLVEASQLLFCQTTLKLLKPWQRKLGICFIVQSRMRVFPVKEKSGSLLLKEVLGREDFGKD